jgi:hypothetical protein
VKKFKKSRFSILESPFLFNRLAEGMIFGLPVPILLIFATLHGMDKTPLFPVWQKSRNNLQIGVVSQFEF